MKAKPSGQGYSRKSVERSLVNSTAQSITSMFIVCGITKAFYGNYRYAVGGFQKLSCPVNVSTLYPNKSKPRSGSSLHSNPRRLHTRSNVGALTEQTIKYLQ